MNIKVASQDHVFGISGLKLNDKIISLGHGIELRPTFAHIFSTDILSFERPATPNSYHPGPWQATSQSSGVDIEAELYIPGTFKHAGLSSVAVGHTIVTLLRLWVDPQINIQIFTDGPVNKLGERAKAPGDVAAMLNTARSRHINIGLMSGQPSFESLEWVQANWETTVNLRASKAEFDFALQTFDYAQSIPNSAMMIVSVWGALEAIFAPHKAELVFRVSSQLASFLAARGPLRLQKQKDIVKLYSLRSAAAHGFPKHSAEDVVKTYELLRMAIIEMIHRKNVPTKEDLERLLFS